MNWTLLMLMGLFASATVCAQSNQLKEKANTNSQKTDKVLSPDSEGIDVYPSFSGGQAALSTFIKKNLRWPTGPKREGKVVVEFTVEKNGKLSGFTLRKSLAHDYDNEALRVIKSSPLWIPGRKLLAKRSAPASYRMTLPIAFSLK
ncbi:energy transducer TonB [Mucilaginibacter psychrotolerans]|uniref:TonB family protein n=1 Tax=Mucilaginibacter psychrotolerans TaxID=1524096 RepID=A0A4Y8S9H6_9SPHI|nr:energy transducer TonB [Mucilaginibacter psychrotolerans]TFF35638.1 TonB family protein [Mucilaginibacter psychrotolerans]